MNDVAMNLNEALSGLVRRMSLFDAESNNDDVEKGITTIESVFGPTPSISTLEEILDFFKQERNRVVRDDIPCVLSEYGLAEATMLDGTKVSLDIAYETKQTNKELLASWLVELGYGSIIKDVLAFEKGQFDDKAMDYLVSQGYSFTRDSTINGNSLKATIKKHLEAGGELPPKEAVEVKVFGYAKVKKPKEGF